MERYLGVWKSYAVFSGRAPRSEYWVFIIVNTVAVFLLGGLSNLLSGGSTGAESEPTYGLFFYVYLTFVLAAFLPGLAVAVRRLHDSGRSGFWFFVVFVPLVGQVAFFVLMLLDSQKTDNQYGSARAV